MKSIIAPPHDDDGILSLSVAYLSGPMDFAADGGVTWRKRIIRECYDKNIMLQFLDPTNKNNGLSVYDELSYSKKCREEGRWKDLTDHVHEFRREDLRCVDYADFIIAYIDTNVHMCGSYDEIINAEREHKPILAIINGGKKKAPTWLFDIINWEEMFDTTIQCVEHLGKINTGKMKTDKRWVLLRKHLHYIATTSERKQNGTN